jgi:predicted permease
MSRAPWFALRVLRRFIRGERRVEMEGDLLEAYEEWVRTLGTARALLRLSREALLILLWQGIRGAKDRGWAPGPSPVGPGVPRRRSGWGGYLSELPHDVGFALRRLSRSPGASLVVIFVLGLGVGGNAAIFTIADALFLKPPPLISDPQELVGLQSTYSEFGYPDFLYYREHGGAFQDVLAYGGFPGTQGRTPKSGGEVVVGRSDDIVQANTWVVSTNYFRVLGVPLLLGGGFTGEVGESQKEHPEVVLSHGFWVRRFGGDPRVIREPLYVNGVPFRIVGVTPERFKGINPTDRLPDLFVPVMAVGAVLPGWDDGMGRYSPSGEPQGGRFLRLVGRLKPGMAWAAAQTQMEVLQQRWERDFTAWAEAVYGEPYEVRIRPEFSLTPGEARQMKRMLSFLWFVVGSVFLVACTNVAILMLARAAGRDREMGIRASLGASRGRIVRQLLTESMVLAVAGGALGIVIAFVATGAASSMLPATVAFDLTPGAAVMLFALGLSTLAVILFGTAPSWVLSGVDVARMLHRSGQERSRALFRGGLVALQTAVSVVLLVLGGLFARSLQQARSAPLGFETDDRLLLSVLLENHGYSEEEGQAFLTEALRRIGSVPGVRSVTAANRMPFQPRNSWDFVVPGTAYAEEGLFAGLNMVAPEYLSVLGIPLVAGRPIGEEDGPGGPPVVVVNRLFADRMWPGQNPVGKVLPFYGDTRWTVVGVAENSVYWQLGEDPVPFVYLPLRQLYTGRMTFHVATGSDPMGAVAGVEHVLRGLDPNLAIVASTVGERLDQQLAGIRRWTRFVALFSSVALLLAMLGLYGVQSFLVTRQARAIAIRLALGAEPHSVVRSVVGKGLIVCGIGLAAGMSAAFVGGRLVESFLFGVSLHDPLIYTSVAGTLVGVSLLASFLPALRASRLSPMEALTRE